MKARILPLVAAFMAVTGSASAGSLEQRVLDLETQVLRLQERQAQDRAERVPERVKELEMQVKQLEERQKEDDQDRLERLQEQRRQFIERFRDVMPPSVGK